jgi:hypothetical protein
VDNLNKKKITGVKQYSSTLQGKDLLTHFIMSLSKEKKKKKRKRVEM